MFLNLIYLVLEIDAADGGRGHLDLSEPAMKHLCSLLQRHVSAFLQGLRRNEVPDVVLGKLGATRRLPWEAVL